MKKHTKILLALGSIATSVAAIPLVAAGCVKTKKPEEPKKPEGEKQGTTPEDPKKPEGEKPGTTPEVKPGDKPEGEKPGTTPEVKPEDKRSEEQKEIDNWIETVKDQFEFSPYNKEEVLKSLKDKTGILVYSYISHNIVLKDNNDSKNWSKIVFSPKDKSLFSQYQLANPTKPTYYNKKRNNNSISGFIDYELKDNKITLKFKGAKFVARKDHIIGTKIVSNEIDLSETQLDKIIKNLKFDIKDKNKEINKLTATDVKLEGNLNGANINSYNFAAKKGDETTLVLTAKISKNSVTQTIVKEIKGFKKQETKPETKKEDEELDPKVKLINKTIEKNKDLFTFKVWDESKKQEVIEKLTKKEAKLFYLGNHNIIIEFDKQEHDKALTQVVFEGKSGAFWSFGRVQLVNHLHHYKDEKVAKDKLELSNCLEYEVKDNKITITWAGGQKDNGVEPFIFGTKTGSQTIELK